MNSSLFIQFIEHWKVNFILIEYFTIQLYNGVYNIPISGDSTLQIK